MKIKQNKPPEGRFQKKFRVSDMNVGDKTLFRIVQGPVARYFHLWPTIDEDPLTKVLKPTWRSANVERDEGNILVKLAQIEKVLKQKHVDEKDRQRVRAMLRKQERYDYAIIRRNTGEPAKVEAMEANWSVMDKISKDSRKTDPVTGNKALLYGMHWMYDWLLEKGTNNKTGYPEYSVAPYQCQTGGKISVDHLDEEKYPIENPGAYFSPEDLVLIEACEWELEDIDKPITAEALLERLTEYPIDVARRDKEKPDRFYLFTDKKDLEAIQQFSKAEAIPIALPAPSDLTALPPAGGDIANPGANSQEIKDADYEVVKEGQPAAEKPAPQQPPQKETVGGPGPVAEEAPITQNNNAGQTASAPPASNPSPSPTPPPPPPPDTQPKTEEKPAEDGKSPFKKPSTSVW